MDLGYLTSLLFILRKWYIVVLEYGKSIETEFCLYTSHKALLQSTTVVKSSVNNPWRKRTLSKGKIYALNEIQPNLSINPRHRQRTYKTITSKISIKETKWGLWLPGTAPGPIGPEGWLLILSIHLVYCWVQTGWWAQPGCGGSDGPRARAWQGFQGWAAALFVAA